MKSLPSLRRSILRTQLLSLLLMAAVLAGVSGYILWVHHGLQSDRRNQALALATTESIRLLLDQPLTQLQVLAQLISESPSLEQAIPLLHRFLEPDGRLQDLILMDPHGIILATAPIWGSHIGFDMGSQDFFRALQESRAPTWSQVYLSPWEDRPSIALSVPAGPYYLTANLSMDGLHAFQPPPDMNTELFITDQTGIYVYHKDQRKTQEREVFPWFRAMTASLENGIMPPQEFITAQGTTICTGALLPHQGWGVFITEHQESRMAPVRKLLVYILLTFAAFLVISLPIYLMALRRLDRPYRIFSQSMASFAQGRLQERLHAESYSEFSMLAQQFNHMAQSIQERQESLQEAQQVQEKLARALQAKNHDLESMIYTASHDLRAPLVNINGFSQELAESLQELQGLLSTPSSPRFAEIIQQELHTSIHYIKSSAQRMESLIQAILQLSRSTRGEYLAESIDTNELVHKLLNDFQFRIQHWGGGILLGNLPSCFASVSDISQVFANLIDNAIKYRKLDLPLLIEISGTRQGDECEYIVQDNGIGLTPHQQSKVFDLFYRASHSKEEGEGLGLTIVKRLVERNNGQIRVEAQVDGGCRFYVRLPAPSGSVVSQRKA